LFAWKTSMTGPRPKCGADAEGGLPLPLLSVALLWFNPEKHKARRSDDFEDVRDSIDQSKSKIVKATCRNEPLLICSHSGYDSEGAADARLA